MSYRFKGVIKRVEVSEKKMKVNFDYSYKLKDFITIDNESGIALNTDKLADLQGIMLEKDQEFIVKGYYLKQIILDNIHKEVEVGFDLDNNAGENSEEDKDSMNDKSYRITDIVIF